MTYLFYESNPWILPALMLAVLSLAIEFPYRIRGLLAGFQANVDAVNVLQAALLTLSAFVLSLSFSQASARFDSRRVIVIAEANAIGKAWLRADQLDPMKSRRFRQILVDQTAAGLAAYERPYDLSLRRKMTERVRHSQDDLWGIASSALRARNTAGLSLLVQSLNDMIDVTAQAQQSLASHVPTAIITLTLCLVALATLSLGVRFALGGSRPPLVSAIFVVAYVIVINMMIDYDRPKTGFVTVSLAPLTEQLQAMRHGR